MSARRVCSGTRPSRYHSIRAISAPPRRPDTLMRTPLAPRRMADCIERFMARRKATRRSSCWAMFSATSWASVSGLRISTMFRWTSPSVMAADRHGALHGAPEGDPALELLGDVLGHQLGVGLGLADLDDVQVDFAVRHGGR